MRGFSVLVDSVSLVWFNCPFCSCVFCTAVDLESHLACFGRKAGLHRRNFDRVHLEGELTLDRKQGGADRIVRDFGNAILDYREKCKASGKKVRVLV